MTKRETTELTRSNGFPQTEQSSVMEELPGSGDRAVSLASSLAIAGTSNEAAIFTEYYLETRPSLRAYLTSFIHNHAAVEDCLQETCLVLWKKKEAHWTLEDFRKVAFTCARFKALSWLKKNKPASHLSFSPEIAQKLALKAAETVGADGDTQSERMEALLKCLETLPEEQRHLIEVRYDPAESEDLVQMAKKKNRTLSALYKQLERTRTALRNCVKMQLTRCKA